VLNRPFSLLQGSMLFRGLRPERVAPAGQLAVSCCGSRQVTVTLRKHARPTEHPLRRSSQR
jgi:hypothetical protein